MVTPEWFTILLTLLDRNIPIDLHTVTTADLTNLTDKTTRVAVTITDPLSLVAVTTTDLTGEMTVIVVTTTDPIAKMTARMIADFHILQTTRVERNGIVNTV